MCAIRSCFSDPKPERQGPPPAAHTYDPNRLCAIAAQKGSRPREENVCPHERTVPNGVRSPRSTGRNSRKFQRSRLVVCVRTRHRPDTAMAATVRNNGSGESELNIIHYLQVLYRRRHVATQHHFWWCSLARRSLHVHRRSNLREHRPHPDRARQSESRVVSGSA